MHGEYKVPGGKLVVVDLELHDGLIARAQVSGDFFLYPEEALPLLAEALEGAPVALDAADYAARVRPALVHAELLGSSPEALGEAVVRALHGTP